LDSIGLNFRFIRRIYLVFRWKKQVVSNDKQVKTTETKQQNERAKPVFDFYQVLPEREVIVESNPIQKDTQTNTTPKQAFQSYILQVGSFNNYADADELKAKLAFLGLEAQLKEASIKNSTWYRVQLGPFESSNGLSKTKNLLIQNKIKYLQKNAG